MKKALLYFGAVVPIIIGAAVYFICRPDTYVSHFLMRFIGGGINHLNVSQKFITCNLCDALWSFSLTVTLYIVTEKPLASFVISAVFSTLIECSQLVPALPGTFDFYDVIFQIAAHVVAIIFIIIVSGGKFNAT